MKPVKFKPYLQLSKTSQGRKSPIFISLTQYSQTALISVGHSIPIEAWDKEECRVYEKKPRITSKHEQSLSKEELIALKKEYAKAIVLSNASSINADIENRMFELTNLQIKLRVQNENLDIKTLKKIYTHNPDLNKKNDFIKFGDELADRLLKNGKIGTYKAYKTVVKKLSDYVENAPLRFQNMDVKFLSDYNAFMRKEELKISSIHNNFKTIKAIFNQAIKEELVSQEKYPFKAFKFDRPGPTKKERLTIEELKSLENLKLEKESLLWHVRNCFIFSFNVAGIRIGDLIFLKWKQINEGRLEYTMSKTGSLKSIKLSAKCVEILSFYFNDKAGLDDYIFPLLSNTADYSDELFAYNQKGSKTAMVNNALKDLAKMAGIKKNLTSHIARHSFGDIARKRNVSLFDLKNMFAHDSVKTTEMYLASLDIESQDETLNKVLELNEPVNQHLQSA